MQRPQPPLVSRVLGFQLGMTLALPLLALPFGMSAAVSVLIGAGVCLLANSAFAYWVSRGYQAREPGVLVARLYGGEIVKLGLILGLFAGAFATVPGLNLPALLAAYFAVQVLPAILASARWGAVRHERDD
jgi:ATP synthase protein I